MLFRSRLVVFQGCIVNAFFWLIFRSSDPFLRPFQYYCFLLLLQAPAVRHVAGILLRKRLPGHYEGFDANSRTGLKAEILNAIAALAKTPEIAFSIWQNIEAAQLISTIPTTSQQRPLGE